ncbi:MAG: glycoside hydrolase family 15 protein [Thermoleophilia bacterium]
MKISDYGFISDCQSAALIDRSGSVDWLCLPRFSSPSVFGRLLDKKAGYWSIRPEGGFTSRRAYIEGTLVLETTFTAAAGKVSITDCLAVSPKTGRDIGTRVPHTLIRSVRGLDGQVPMVMEFLPRMEYGVTVPRLVRETGVIQARGGPVALKLHAPVPVDMDDSRATAAFTVAAGERLDFSMAYERVFSAGEKPAIKSAGSLEQTVSKWRSWTREHQRYDGLYPRRTRLSALVLQGLTYSPSGAIVAAATTSLPEESGSDANWDYRYAWLRDASLIMRALWVTSRQDEPRRFFDWISEAGGVLAAREDVQIMYGLEGERDLSEHILDHLAGFNGSRPVRVGNGAWKQTQLDVLGEVLNAAFRLRNRLEFSADRPLRETLINFADLAARHWQMPDSGIWESRGEERHYLLSKVMCWVALDRAVKLAGALGAQGKKAAWARRRDEIHRAVLSEGWSEPKKSFTGWFGSSELDAAALMLPLVGFLPADEPRMRATIDAVSRELGDGSLVRRRAGEKNGFLVCSFWLVECLAMLGKTAQAAENFESLLALANDLALLSEQADPATGDLWGNFPQAFSHVGLINAAWRLTLAERGQAGSLDLD